MRKFFQKKSWSSAPFSDPVVNVSSEVPEVNKWEVSRFVVEQLVPVCGVHPFPLDELMLMTTAVCRFRPQLICEWGTNIGKSARIFYEITKAFRIKAEIHSVDLPDDIEHNEHPKNDRGIMVRGIQGVTLHQADGLDRSLQLYREKKPASVLFFVDGDHSYASVKRELSAILQQCPEAVVLLHDTFYQSEDAGYNIGPYKAITELTAGDQFRVMSTQAGLPGMSLVYRT
jgi:cephalosporin hydroxylase